MASRASPRPVALDHNFPEPVLKQVLRFMSEVAFHWIREIGTHFSDMDDHDLVYELHRAGFSVMLADDTAETRVDWAHRDTAGESRFFEIK